LRIQMWIRITDSDEIIWFIRIAQIIVIETRNTLKYVI
jgi:hypothetical protein